MKKLSGWVKTNIVLLILYIIACVFFGSILWKPKTLWSETVIFFGFGFGFGCVWLLAILHRILCDREVYYRLRFYERLRLVSVSQISSEGIGELITYAVKDVKKNVDLFSKSSVTNALTDEKVMVKNLFESLRVHTFLVEAIRSCCIEAKKTSQNWLVLRKDLQYEKYREYYAEILKGDNQIILCLDGLSNTL